MCLLFLDMNRPSFHRNESSTFNRHPPQNVNPWQNDFRGFVSYPAKYYSRPPRPTDCGRLAVRSSISQWPAAVHSEPYLQTKNSSSTFSRSSLQNSTSDIPAKKSAIDDCIDASLPASTSSTSGTVEQLKWHAGEGPSVDLRLLVPGKVL